jgi:undecaprenyl-diphosphatase
MSRRSVAVGAIAVVAFVMLGAAVVVGWEPLARLDGVAVLDAHADVLAHSWLLTVAVIVTDAGSPVAVDVVTAVAAVVLLLARRWRAAAFVVVARLLELGVETVVKDLVARPRPVLIDPVSHASGFSFPSGHAAGSAAVFGAVLVVVLGELSAARRALRTSVVGLVVVFVAGVAASRVMLGVHYPSDVTGGVLLGIASLVAARCVLPRVDPEVTTRAGSRPPSE